MGTIEFWRTEQQAHPNLVGNVNDGRIHAFEAGNGEPENENDSDSAETIRTLKVHGKPFAVPGLWALAFGSGAGGKNGASNRLFFAAGPGPTPAQVFSGGVFGVITAESDPKH